MEALQLPATHNSPKIDFNPNGELLIEGRCIPEHTPALFQPLIDWIKEYSTTPANTTTLTIRVDYFNSSSHKYFVDLIGKLDELIHKKGNKSYLKWHYEEDDDEMEEVGEEFQELFELPVKMVAEEEID